MWLSGLGVYLGRVRRWNSWDLLLNPGAVLADVITLVVHPLAHAQTHAVVMIVGVLLLVGYLMFAGSHAPSISAAEQSDNGP